MSVDSASFWSPNVEPGAEKRAVQYCVALCVAFDEGGGELSWGGIDDIHFQEPFADSEWGLVECVYQVLPGHGNPYYLRTHGVSLGRRFRNPVGRKAWELRKVFEPPLPWILGTCRAGCGLWSATAPITP